MNLVRIFFVYAIFFTFVLFLSPAVADAADRYWVGGTGNWSDATNHWSDTSGGAPNASFLPTAVDDVFFDANSHNDNYTVTIDATTKLMDDLTFAAPSSGNVTWAGSVQMDIYGNITKYSGMTHSYTGTVVLKGTIGTQTIISAGVTWLDRIFLEGTSTVMLGDDLPLGIAGRISPRLNSIFDTDGYDIIGGQVNISSTATVYFRDSNIYLAGTNGVMWAQSGTPTIDFGTSTIYLRGALTNNRFFGQDGFSNAYHNVRVETTGAFAVIILGSNSFNSLYIDASVTARGVNFVAGTTQNIDSFTRDSGTNIVTINSITAANTVSTDTHTLTKSGGGVVSVDYLNIQHSIATPSNTWFAGVNSTNNQAVLTAGSGWLFTDFPPDDPTTLGPTQYVNGSSTRITTPTITFTLSDQNITDTLQYRIQIDDTADFSSPLVDYTSALVAQGGVTFTVGQAEGAGTYTIGSEAQTLTDASYYLRVKAIDQVTAESSYVTANSGAIAFTVDTLVASSSGSRPKSKSITSIPTPTLNPATPTSSVCVVITNILKLNSRSADVSCLQQKLNTLLTLNLATDGVFGPLTKQAVVNFQIKNNLVADGIVGPMTRGMMK